MKKTIRPLLVLGALSLSEPVIVEMDLNRLVKAQQDLENNTRQENKVAKKDVYSETEKFNLNDIEFTVEEHCVELDALIIENNFITDVSMDEISSKITGRCLGAAGIGQLANALQDYFIHSGYITTRIEIPSQDLATKKLKLEVIPGRIENVAMTNNDIKEWILPFKAGQILNIRDIEQGLEVLQKTPGLNVGINIEPGSLTGYSIVVINMERTVNWNARTWVNNWGDEGTGKNLFGVAGYFYNLAKMNDVFYLSGTSNAEKVRGRYNSLSSFYSLPYGYWDYEFFYSNTLSRQVINIGPYDFNYTGKSQNLSVKAARTVYRDQDKKVALSAELIRRKVGYKLEDIELALQKRDMTNLRFGINFKRNIPGSLVDATFSYQRFLPWLGGEATPDMRSGDVSQQSHVLNLDMSYTRLLNFSWVDSYYELRLGTQYSPDALTLQDQFSIGERWNVRGFENSAGIYGNKGLYAQNTINFITGLSDLEWYIGTDYGAVFKDKNAQDSINKRELVGTVTGLKGSIKTLTYDVSLSKPLVYPRELNADKFNISFNFSYQL